MSWLSQGVTAATSCSRCPDRDPVWPSQYPHEREILFGPLTGIEVMRTRTDSSVVVIECAFSINLNALTLEQVVSKRRKV
eukprot:4723557-Prymnesium_polylepis.2